MKRTILTLALLFSTPVLAFDIPALKAPVNDYARLLTPVQIGQLNDRLRSIEAASQDDAQFVVLTLPSLDGESIDKVRNDIFHAWKLGRAGKDNGVLLIIAPVERKIGIEVGYGLEPYLPDGLTKTITEEKIKPHLKKGSEDWFAAIDGGVQAIGAVVVAREKAAPAASSHGLFWPIAGFLGFCGALAAGIALASGRKREREAAEEAARFKAQAASKQHSNPYSPCPSNLAAAAIGAGAGYAMASKPRPAPKPTPSRPASRSSSYDSSPSYSSSYSGSSSSSSSSSSDSGSSYSGGGGDSGGGGSSSDF